MRYAKGSIQLGQVHDYPLLRQVLQSGFVTQDQLYSLMHLSHHEWNRHSFTWRLRRLVKHGFVVRHSVPAVAGSQFIYSIGDSGAMLLQGAGEYCLIGPRREDKAEDGATAFHALEVNEIHLTLLRSGLAFRWIPATEIRSQNEFTTFGYAKDYDAVVEITCADGSVKFGLEYERSAKAERHYRLIAHRMTQERHLGHVLYLLPNRDLADYVARFFTQRVPRVYFGLVQDWHAQVLEMPVLAAPANKRISLGEGLGRSTSFQVA
jgi:hypothetical protein